MTHRWLCIVLVAGCVEHFDPVYDDDLGPPAQEPGHPPPPPIGPITPLQKFSGCLTFQDFHRAGVWAAWRTVNAPDAHNLQCMDCHFTEGFHDEQLMFRSISHSREILEQQFEVIGTRMKPELVSSAQTLDKVAAGVGQYAAHPTFETGEVLSTLEVWGALATERQRAGECGHPTAF